MHTVLIVEDNDKNMKLVRDVLNIKGYATLEATTGEEAIRMAIEHVPDLILMDIQLPDINGIHAFARIRGNASTAHVPVAAVTASVTVSDRSRVTEAGFDAFISKPLDLKGFLETVQRVLSERNP